MSSSAGLARPAGGRALVSLGSEHLALRPVPTPQHAAPGGNRTTVGEGVNEAPSEPKARMHPGQGRSAHAPRAGAQPPGQEAAPSHPGQRGGKSGRARGGNSIAGILVTLPASGNILNLFTSLLGKGRGQRPGLRL